MHIVVVEFRYSGLTHADFNAALLAALRQGYPDADIQYLAITSQARCTREALYAMDPVAAATIHFEPFPYAVGKDSILGFLKECYRWVRLATYSSVREADILVFTATNTASLGILKLLSLLLSTPKSVWVVFHSLLARLLAGDKALRATITLPQSENLKFLVLGPTIERNLRGLISLPANRLHSIEMPYFMKEASPAPTQGERIRFSFLGFATREKGILHFADLAHRFDGLADFELVGSVLLPEMLQELRNRTNPLQGLTGESIKPDEYARRVRTSTYLVGPYDPTHYRLTASASFLDSLAFAKPGIFLRSEYLEDCFSQLGDVGYLCDSVEEMHEIMHSIILEFPAERYAQQCTNILQNRARYSPEAVGAQLARLLPGNL